VLHGRILAHDRAPLGCGEAPVGVLGQCGQLPGDALHLAQQPHTLAPQVLDLGVQLAGLGLGGLLDRRCLALGAGQAVVGLRLGPGGDVLRHLGGTLEHRAGLLAHTGQRVAHGAVGPAQGHRLVDEAAHTSDVGVHRVALVAPHASGELDPAQAGAGGLQVVGGAGRLRHGARGRRLRCHARPVRHRRAGS
jgi:hypothetical protein